MVADYCSFIIESSTVCVCIAKCNVHARTWLLCFFSFSCGTSVYGSTARRQIWKKTALRTFEISVAYELYVIQHRTNSCTKNRNYRIFFLDFL